ncbi:MAG: vWA domain-containing protein [Pseudomonadota bacterium]
MRERRRGIGAGLAFLDVMSCGLGASILIFLLIKHNTEQAGSVESDRVIEQLETMEREVARFRNEIDDIAKLNATEQLLGSELRDQRESALAQLNALDVRMSAQREVNRQLQRSVEEREQQLATDIIEAAGAGQENYVTGLRVSGRRIAIMLDHSASMTDEKLTDIFRYKVAPEAERRASPKWLRAKKATRWLLARAPEQSEVAVVAFAEQGKVLGSGDWFASQDKPPLDEVQRDLETLAPTGATNLEEGLASLAGLSPPPTDVYLITDGLPTRATTRGRCARGPRVTAQCRDSLFQNAARQAASQIGRFKMNVVLLPLEGDWNAGPAYMQWAVSAGGTLISPPASWP